MWDIFVQLYYHAEIELPNFHLHSYFHGFDHSILPPHEFPVQCLQIPI